MSQLTDPRLLGELNELQGSCVYEYLKELETAAVQAMVEATTDRQAAVASGQVRQLQQILKDIDSARDTFQAIKEQTAIRKTVDMKKAF